MYFSIQAIDYGFFEAVRLQLVADGYLPDILDFNTASDFTNAQKSLGNNLIKLFGVGHRYERGALQGNVIIIERIEETDGTAGFNELDESFNATSGNFEGRAFPRHTVNVEYDVRYMTDNVSSEYKIESVLRKVFDKKGYLNAYQSDGTVSGKFRYVKTRLVDVSSDRFIERGYRIEAREIFLHQNTISESAAPLGDGSVEVNL